MNPKSNLIKHTIAAAAPLLLFDFTAATTLPSSSFSHRLPNGPPFCTSLTCCRHSSWSSLSLLYHHVKLQPSQLSLLYHTVSLPPRSISFLNGLLEFSSHAFHGRYSPSSLTSLAKRDTEGVVDMFLSHYISLNIEKSVLFIFFLTLKTPERKL